MAEVKLSVVSALPGGMNASMHPGILPDGQYARGVNIAVRGGYARTRPGFHSFSSDVAGAIASTGTVFQGAGVWRVGKDSYIATVFSGVVRLTNFHTGVTIEVGPYLDVKDPVYIVQAGKFLLFHGGGLSFLALAWEDEAPVVKRTPLLPESMLADSWDTRMQGISMSAEVSARMETHTEETYEQALAAVLEELDTPTYPPGTISCFAHGRVHLVTDDPGGAYFRSSDILLPSDPFSVTRWWEDSYLNGGGALGLPDELGEIRGMAALQNSGDTASGIGPLVVLAQDGAAAFSINLPREGTFDISFSSSGAAFTSGAKLLTPGWKDRQIAQILFYGGGTESPRSLCRVNGDLMYRSPDGIRSLKTTAESATGAVVANTPMSAEVQPFIDMDTEVSGLAGVSAASADNRVLMTASERSSGYAGMVAFDTAVLAPVERAKDPTATSKHLAYDGLWTGVTVAQLLPVGNTLVIIASDGRMYKLSKDPWDMVDNVRRDIECQLVTKSVDMASPGVAKRLTYVDVWMRDMLGDVSCKLYYRPDNFPWWTQAGPEVNFECPSDLPPQERRRIRFTPENNNLYSYDGTVLTDGETFQFMLVWTGQATMHRLLAAGRPMTETPPRSTLDCDLANIERDETQIEQNDFSYPR